MHRQQILERIHSLAESFDKYKEQGGIYSKCNECLKNLRENYAQCDYAALLSPITNKILQVTAVNEYPKSALATIIQNGQSLSHFAISVKQAVAVPDISDINYTMHYYQVIKEIKSEIAIPFYGRDDNLMSNNPIAVIVFSSKERGYFSEKNIEKFNPEMPIFDEFRECMTAYSNAVREIGKITIEYESGMDPGHSIRVMILGRSLGLASDLPAELMPALDISLLLHDLGKSTIRREILNKPSRLTDAEWEEMKTHPERGYEMLDLLGFPENEKMAVLFHHKNKDGTGYPDKEWLGSRLCDIVSVADKTAAMIGFRSYRQKNILPLEDVIEELLMETKHNKIDEKLANTMISILKKNPFIANI